MHLFDPSFLLKISSIVREVHIRAEILEFLYMSGFDCTKLIVSMYTNKMDKLSTHEVYSRWMPTRRCIDYLAQELPKLGKKLWFKTKIKAIVFDDNFDYMINEHRIRADGEYFSIIHTSREDEQ
ncbi:hypothetical protein PMAYCL1PPCAC_20878 [Pristionchus mayeri]|uniref:Uncharacterized protein n=1 Tax=Pristionchus mayeri TaxID=1317129 RepID=A0AAN5I3J4_9BILA|nr:hypothetical protein PMAYCL1PPCAC_20878 [Pristionchus mayeri]